MFLSPAPLENPRSMCDLCQVASVRIAAVSVPCSVVGGGTGVLCQEVWLAMEHRWVKQCGLTANDVENGGYTISLQPRPFPGFYRPADEGHALPPLPLPNSLPLNFSSFCTDPLRGKLRRNRPPGWSQGKICQGFREGTCRIPPISLHVSLSLFCCLSVSLRRHVV